MFIRVVTGTTSNSSVAGVRTEDRGQRRTATEVPIKPNQTKSSQIKVNQGKKMEVGRLGTRLGTGWNVHETQWI